MSSKQSERLKLLLGDATIEAAENAAASTRSVPTVTASNVDTPSVGSRNVKHRDLYQMLSSLETPTQSVATNKIDSLDKMAQKANMAVQDSKGLSVGQLAPLGIPFCPIISVSKFPYTQMNARSKDSERVSQGYFASGRFWERTWSL